MHDHGEGVADIAVEQEIQLDQIAGHVALQLVIHAGVAAAAALERIEEIKDHFIQRHIVGQLDAATLVLHILEHAALILAQIHQRAHIILRGVDGDQHKRLAHGGNFGYGRQVGGVIDHDDLAAGFGYFIDYAGRGGDQIQVKLTLQAHLDDFHVQQAQEAAAEAVAQRHAGFGIIG